MRSRQDRMWRGWPGIHRCRGVKCEFPELTACEAHGQPVEGQQARRHGAATEVAEAQGWHPPLVDIRGPIPDLKGFGAEQDVMAEALDARQAPVGHKTDLLEILDVARPSAETEVAGVVEDGFRAQGTALPCLIRECL